MKIKYWVECKHPVKTCYVNGLHTFRVGEDRDGKWYADADKFGMSKSYRTPRDAIEHMVNDHGGTVVDVLCIGPIGG